MVTSLFGADDKVLRAGDSMTGNLTLLGTPPLTIPAGAAAGKVLTCDGSGNVSWQAASGGVSVTDAPYNADPTGIADSTAAIQAAVTAAITAGGGNIWLPAGTYKVSSTITANVNGTAVNISGAGWWNTFISYTGTGDCLRIYDTSTYGSRVNSGGSLTGLTVDGTSAGTGACGVHMGDIFQYVAGFAVQNFTTTGGIGAHFDNENYWTEQLHGTVRAYNCTSHVVFDTGGAGTGSFARTDLTVWMTQGNASFSGVVLQNGATIYDGSLTIRGNFTSSSSALTGTPAVLAVTGQSGGHYSQIFASTLNIQAECPANTHAPQTILFGTPGANFIRGCAGILDFSSAGANFARSNIGGSPGALWFTGIIAGDTTLCPANVPAGSGSLPAIAGSLLYTSAFADGSGGVYSYSGDFFQWTMSRNAVIGLGADFSATSPGAPQRLTIVIRQAASGGPYTVTWPHNASPTTAAPKVTWAGGAAPVMTAAASAVDVYKLETIDGATWYGQAIQNVS